MPGDTGSAEQNDYGNCSNPECGAKLTSQEAASYGGKCEDCYSSVKIGQHHGGTQIKGSKTSGSSHYKGNRRD